MPDNLVERLTAFTRDVSDSARLVPAGAVRTKGDRRRVQLVGVTAVTAGVVTAVTGVAVTTTVGGGGGADTTAGAGTIPGELVMPHEGEPGWTRDDNPQVAGVFQPCTGHDVSLPGRTDARTMTGPGRAGEEEHSPTVITNQLFLYGSESDAKAVMENLNADIGRCGWLGGTATGTVYGRYVVMAWDFVEPSPPITRVLAFRRGNAIYVSNVVVSGALMSSGDYEAVEEMGWRLCAVLDLCEPQLCYSPRPSPSAPVEARCPPAEDPSPNPTMSTDPSPVYPTADPTVVPTSAPPPYESASPIPTP